MIKAMYEKTIELKTHQIVHVELGSIHKIGVQGQSIMLWYEDTDNKLPKHAHNIYIVGTGNREIESDWIYLDTVFMDGFVWHVYMKPAL